MKTCYYQTTILTSLAILLASCTPQPTQSPTATFEYAPGKTGSAQTITFYMSDKQQVANLTYEEIDGLAIFEGDIILGNSAELQEVRPKESEPICVGDVCEKKQALSVRFGEAYLWPGGLIPFEIDPSFSTQGVAEINAGINIITGSTNLLLSQHNGERDYIVFVPSNGCSSSVGRQIGRQEVRVVDSGVNVQSCGAVGVAHETLHAAGLWHEQSRSDRDNHVTILWSNILSGKEHNFEIHATDGVDIGPYDLQSIMHYGATDFGKTDPSTGLRLTTIETNPLGGVVGGATGLSGDDITGINQLYPMSGTTRYVPIPGLVFGLRHSQNQSNDYIQPFIQFGNVSAQRIHGGDLGAPSGVGFDWWMIPTNTPLSSVRIEEIPPGVVIGLWHSQNMNSIAGDPRLITVKGGDLGAPSGVGFVWYENQSTAQVNWNIVNMLPPYTVVGLKHSQNQKNKTFLWSDGLTYDPLVTCPDGFDRKNGGDLGAPSGTGFFWCEKRRP